jgi:hypothetical protein
VYGGVPKRERISGAGIGKAIRRLSFPSPRVSDQDYGAVGKTGCAIILSCAQNESVAGQLNESVAGQLVEELHRFRGVSEPKPKERE